MTPSFNAHNKEHPSTYFVQDRSNQEELQRLQIQDHLLTSAMGGVLPEQPDTQRFTRVLDIGCGPGGWLIALAHASPDCETLIGLDLSTRLVTYARTPADGSCKGNTIYRRRFTARTPIDRAFRATLIDPASRAHAFHPALDGTIHPVGTMGHAQPRVGRDNSIELDGTIHPVGTMGHGHACHPLIVIWGDMGTWGRSCTINQHARDQSACAREAR